MLISRMTPAELNQLIVPKHAKRALHRQVVQDNAAKSRMPAELHGPFLAKGDLDREPARPLRSGAKCQLAA